MSLEAEKVETPIAKNPHIECAVGCPPSHKIARRVTTSIVVIMLVLLAVLLVYLKVSGGTQ